MIGSWWRVLLIVAIVAGGARVAGAKTKPPKGQKVHLETEPPGADVYLGDKDAGAAGQTPLDLTLPDGEHTLILELEGHVPKFEVIVVEKRTGKAAKAAQDFSFTLDPSSATLIVNVADDAPIPEGSTVVIDGEDQGAPPVSIQVEVGAHQVQLIAPGRDPYEEWVEVEGGEEHVLTVSAASLGGPVVEEEAPKPKSKGKRIHGPIGVLRTGVEIGFRKFRYDAPRTANLRPYDASGSVQIVIDAELHPWRRFVANRVLDRLSLTGGAGLAPTITVRGMGETIEGYWRTQHAGVRFRALNKPQLAIDVEGGWMHLLYTFRDMNNLPVDEVPDVNYHMIRIGGRVVYRRKPVEAWLGVDNRLVVTAGPLEERFAAADVDGFGLRAGAAMWLLDRHLEGRVEGTLTRFGYTFQSEAGDAFDADGGSDTLYGITISVGGAY